MRRRSTDDNKTGMLFVPEHAGTYRPATFPDPPARKRGPATSKAAARSMRSAAPSIRDRVLLHIADVGERGATNEQLADALGLRMSTVTARVNELSKRGYVRDSGERRVTTSGRSAIVWKTRVAPSSEGA